MISQIGINMPLNNSQTVNSKHENKQVQKEVKSKENSRVESIKKSILEGSYKRDLDKTAQKIADTLL